MAEVMFTYEESEECKFKVTEGEFVAFLGKGNNRLLKYITFEKKNDFIQVGYQKLSEKNLYKVRKTISFLLFKHLDIFLGETVRDEIAYGMESLAYKKHDIMDNISKYSRYFNLDDLLDRDPNSLGVSDKIKVKLASVLCLNPKVIVVDDLLTSLDRKDDLLVCKSLNAFVKDKGVVLLFTSNIEDAMNSSRIIITARGKILVDGEKLSVLNEESILKKLGIGLPFMIELNKYFMDYELIDEYELDMEKLVDMLWK